MHLPTYQADICIFSCTPPPLPLLPPAAAAECTICRPGTIAAKPRAATCDACPRGTFQQRFGGTKCDACPRGTYQDARSQPRCKVCPVGTFNNVTGSFAVGACR